MWVLLIGYLSLGELRNIFKGASSFFRYYVYVLISYIIATSFICYSDYIFSFNPYDLSNRK